MKNILAIIALFLLFSFNPKPKLRKFYFTTYHKVDNNGGFCLSYRTISSAYHPTPQQCFYLVKQSIDTTNARDFVLLSLYEFKNEEDYLQFQYMKGQFNTLKQIP